ncbi:MAG TPA: hypothetical protein VF204_18750, partial [Streptosporangiaceae bacterium]
MAHNSQRQPLDYRGNQRRVPVRGDIGQISNGLTVAATWPRTRLHDGYFLIWRMPRVFVAGSVIHAAQAKPMSAMPLLAHRRLAERGT